MGAVGLWPRMPRSYLPELVGEQSTAGEKTELLEAQHWCMETWLCEGLAQGYGNLRKSGIELGSWGSSFPLIRTWATSAPG